MMSGDTVEPIHILILEDDPVMRGTLLETLQEEGYQATAVGSGVEALEHARSENFDLIVADVRMEGIDGLTAIEQVKEHSPGIRSLVVSGYCDEADTLRALRLGVGDFLKKPFRIQDLLDSVRRQAMQKKLESEKQADREALLMAAFLALEARARLFDSDSPGLYPRTSGVAGLAEWARATALDQGMSDEECRQAAVLALLMALPEEPRFSTVEAGFPDSLRQTIQQLREAPLSPLAHLVWGVLCYARWQGEVESLIAQGLKPDLVETLQRLEEHGLSSAGRGGGERARGQQRRGLLALAGALEGKGDLEAARAAFSAVLEEEVSPEGVQAQLGLARLLKARGDGAGVLARCRQAVEMAARLGPHSLASTKVESAFLAFPYDRQGGLEGLREACEAFQRFGRSAEYAKARLALWVVSGEQGEVAEVLAELCQPTNSDELALSARWLTPALLERCPTLPEAENALFQIARLFPGELQRLLLRGRLSPGARANLVPILARADSHQLLKLLGQDPDPGVKVALQRARSGGGAERVLFRLFTLGNFAIYRGEERLSDKLWHRSKNRLLFARIAAVRGAISEDRLIEEFWPGDLRKGKQNIYAAASTIKRCLGGEEGEKTEWLQRAEMGLTISSELPLWHDLHEVESGFAKADSSFGKGFPQEAYEALERVHKLYRGPYLEGCYEDWACTIRGTLENQMVSSFGKLCAWLEGQGRGEELGEFAQRILSVDPCCQQAHVFVMRSLLLTERPEEAARHFERARLLLTQELAMEPSIEMMREHQRALLAIA